MAFGNWTTKRHHFDSVGSRKPLGFGKLELRLDGATGKGEPHADLSIWHHDTSISGYALGVVSMEILVQPTLVHTVVDGRLVYFAAQSTTDGSADILWIYPTSNPD